MHKPLDQHRNLNYSDVLNMGSCIISKSTQQNVVGCLYMTVAGSLFCLCYDTHSRLVT